MLTLSYTRSHTPIRTHTHIIMLSRTNELTQSHTPTLRVPTGLICKNCSKKDNFCQAWKVTQMFISFHFGGGELKLEAHQKKCLKKGSFKGKKADRGPTKSKLNFLKSIRWMRSGRGRVGLSSSCLQMKKKFFVEAENQRKNLFRKKTFSVRPVLCWIAPMCVCVCVYKYAADSVCVCVIVLVSLVLCV